MFIKPFKLKSSVQLKGSDTKKMRSRILQSFPNLDADHVATLLPSKAAITFIKIITHGGMLLGVYSVDKRPMFFEDEGNDLVPTLYTLWMYPDLLPYFTTHPAVLPKLANGADLMLPGVIRQESGLNAYGHYKKDQLVAVNLTSNKSAVGIGRLARSSNDLFMAAGYGPCVKMLHVFGDKLWGIEPSVTLKIPDSDSQMIAPVDDDFPELGAQPKKNKVDNKPEVKKDVSIEPVELLENEVKEIQIDDSQQNNEIIEQTNETTQPQQETVNSAVSMDNVLLSAFLTSLKFNKKNLSLPVLTSNFYRLHVLPSATQNIDMKQTTYKKFSKFLHAMSEKGMVVVREETKGVEKIISVDFDHPDIINFTPCDNAQEQQTSNEPQLFHSEMMELYTVGEETIELFSKLSFRKGDGIAQADIKKQLREYINKYKLPYVVNTKIIKLDEVLTNICKKDECSFDELYHTVLANMKHTYGMRQKNEVFGNKPPIHMSLATRSGNKKVTLVTNLEAYGIIITEFVKACKLGAAASTTIIKLQNQKYSQLQIQGNQVRFIYNLLTETYKIPARQIFGLELAKNEKKKKK